MDLSINERNSLLAVEDFEEIITMSEDEETPEWMPKVGDTVIRDDNNFHSGGVEATVVSIKDGEFWLRLKAENNIVIESINHLRPLNKIDSFDYNAFFRDAQTMTVKDRNVAAEAFTSRSSKFKDRALPHNPEAAIKLWKMNVSQTNGESGAGEYGGYLYELGRIEEAVEVFKLGSHVNPNSAFGAAVSLEQLERFDEAFLYYKKAINVEDRVHWHQYSKFNAMNTLAEFYLLGLGCQADKNEAMRCAYRVYEYARRHLLDEFRDKFYVTYAYFLQHSIGVDPNPGLTVDFRELYMQGTRLHIPLLMRGLESVRVALDPTLPNTSPLTNVAPASTAYNDRVLDKIRTTFDDYHWTHIVEYNRRNLHRPECQELIVYCYAYGILQQKQDVKKLIKLLDEIDGETRLLQSWKSFLDVRRKFCCRVNALSVPDIIIQMIIMFELWICPKLPYP